MISIEKASLALEHVQATLSHIHMKTGDHLKPQKNRRQLPRSSLPSTVRPTQHIVCTQHLLDRQDAYSHLRCAAQRGKKMIFLAYPTDGRKRINIERRWNRERGTLCLNLSASGL